MWKWRIRRLWPVLLLLIGAHGHAAESVDGLLAAASNGGAYVVQAADDVEQAEKLFFSCFDQCDSPESRQRWGALGFDVLATEWNGHPVVIVREQAARKEGRGFYLFRQKSDASTLLEAPHSFKDENTRAIALQLMEQGDFRAAAWNTTPRRYESNGIEIDADMAHLRGTYFLAFGKAFARRFKGGTLVQLHGFAKEKRRSQSGTRAEIVMSAGGEVITPKVSRMEACLQQAGDFGDVLVYPTEIRELGGTKNATAILLRAMGHEGFVHLEISSDTRRTLVTSAALRLKFLRCLENR